MQCRPDRRLGKAARLQNTHDHLVRTPVSLSLCWCNPQQSGGVVSPNSATVAIECTQVLALKALIACIIGLSYIITVEIPSTKG